LLNLLLDAMGLPPLPASLRPDDPTQRVANPVEVRPDLLLVAEGLRGDWVLVEVQLAVDPDKQRTWLAATAVLYDARRTMGDLLVITHDASVAAWAHTVAQATGPGGTHLSLCPRVLLLTRAAVERQLAAGRPELAVMAVWAVHDQKGRAALQVVRDAYAQVVNTSDPKLRDTLRRAMLSMLDADLLKTLQELMMLTPESFPLDPEREAIFQLYLANRKMRDEAMALATAWAKVRDEGKIKDKADDVLKVLQARGIAVDDASRARILACTDLVTLFRWVVRAATLSTLADVLADGP